MSKLIDFGGETHALSPIGGGEHTLCGVAFDAADSEADEALRFSEASRRKVTCDNCGSIILWCRGLSVQGTKL